MNDAIVVLNLSNPVSRAITRKLRAERISCRVLTGNTQLEDIQNYKPLGLVIAGADTGKADACFDSRILQAGIPILAIGDASLYLAELLGSSADEQPIENGLYSIRFSNHVLTGGIDDQERMLKSVAPVRAASGIIPLCTCGDDRIIGYGYELLPVFGMALPVEQNDPDMSVLLKNFAENICGCPNDWDDERIIANAQNEICSLAGDGDAVCVLSGGLSTAVCAVLAHKAIGSRLKCIFVETGLLRRDECSLFFSNVVNKLGLNAGVVDKSNEILGLLKDVTDPDEKVRIISDCREKAVYEQLEQMENVTLLIRGNNMSDRMHGKVPSNLPGIMNDRYNTCEPLSELFRDEIKHLAEILGMPADFLCRQAFPGTGLALRIGGRVEREKLDVLRECDAVLTDEIENAGIKRLMKYYACISAETCDKEKYVIHLRAVSTGENGGALPARLPYDVLERVVDRILRNCGKVGKVLYDMTPAGNFNEIETR